MCLRFYWTKVPCPRHLVGSNPECAQPLGAREKECNTQEKDAVWLFELICVPPVRRMARGHKPLSFERSSLRCCHLPRPFAQGNQERSSDGLQASTCFRELMRDSFRQIKNKIPS